jgi:acetyltransferase-like isoleucine patch superfamily enzyme
MIANTVKEYGKVEKGKGRTIGEYSLIGYYTDSDEIRKGSTIIGNNCKIGSHVIICYGTEIQEYVEIEDFSRIGENVKIGARSKVLYGKKVYNDTIIGADVIIGGFVCERAKIGNKAKIFGELVHTHNNPVFDWDDDDAQEKSPIIEDYSIIGFGAKIIGNIRIGRKTYITAGSIVTRDVPQKCVVSGINVITPYKEWDGNLAKSRFFED